MATSIQRIVVATDLSDRAAQAAERAAQLAAEHGAKLELWNAAPLPLPVPIWGGDLGIGAGIDAEEVVSASLTHLTKLATELRQRHGVQATLHCEAKAALPMIRGRLAQDPPDLLVIGATGEGALAQRLFGSNAQSILRHSPVPVLVVRRPVEGPYQRLLLATDFSEDALHAARFARGLVAKAEAHVFAALDLPRHKVEPIFGLDPAERETRLAAARKSATQGLMDFADAVGAPQATVFLRDGRASHEMPEVLRLADADLVCVGAHGKSRIEAAMLGSTSLHAAAESPCDVLVVPHPG